MTTQNQSFYRNQMINSQIHFLALSYFTGFHRFLVFHRYSFATRSDIKYCFSELHWSTCDRVILKTWYDLTKISCLYIYASIYIYYQRFWNIQKPNCKVRLLVLTIPKRMSLFQTGMYENWSKCQKYWMGIKECFSLINS